MSGTLILAIAAVGCVACSSSDTASPLDGPLVDARPVVADGGTSFTCATTVASYCATADTCIVDFADVPACGGAHDGTETCGTSHAFVVGGVDTSHASYYDADGHLVAIVDFVLNRFTCTAGPSNFVAPSCGVPVPLPACPDAGL
jgi:hypothetical protein